MPAIVQLEARSRWRLRAVFDGAYGGLAAAGSYTLTRADGLATTVAVARAWAVDAAAAELALTEALREGVVYVLAASGAGNARVAVPLSAPDLAALGLASTDPEAEALGVDVDWLAPALGPDGDAPRVAGRACYLHDLAAIAQTHPGELHHRPDAGAALPAEVNGPSDLGAIVARVRREWARDPRTARLDVTATLSTAGEVTVDARVTPRALPDAGLPLTVRGT